MPKLDKPLSSTQTKCLNCFLGFILGLSISLIPRTVLGEVTASTQSMNWFQAAVLGMVQGLTEFLPISSTAHLKAVPVALGWGDPGVTFTAVIQLGSIAAVIWYFYDDLKQITLGMIKAVRKSEYKSNEFRLAIGIALGTIPIVVVGLLLKVLVPDLDNSPLRSMTAIALASIVMASLLALAERLSNKERSFEQLTVKDGIWMGLAQSLALIPGVSRSGSTMTAGLFVNLQRATAARFSFLLGIPAITLAGLVELKEILSQGVPQSEIISVIIGIISSGIFSYLAIAWLIRYLQTKDTWIFVWYRLLFGLAILVGIFTKVIPN
ncbi:undecaprenyl-diphosphate phosphatase [Gloeocapsa sp. PCC 73106]|uniref:undecaprenyl-diphosphate phosphatase n=1 Tax=Gloeocapsa sp. PCC 73106 TaxID=102232 RepID=UPI0002AC1861|nr:undecaprenyl-diphosphate phosphatase [Gloeocapsa sp. PCC 73106]ELR96348.1 undecaprenyl-diphosphatase UppP [Gloeocapsa sp. PCC 73106]